MLRSQQCLAALAYLVVGLVASAAAAVEITAHTTNAGNRYLLVSGEFQVGEDLSALVTLTGSHQPAFVTFDSTGGSVLGAMTFGRAIRALGIRTVQIRQLECSSACALAFLGGTTRDATSGAIGVHRASFIEGTFSGVDEAVAETQRSVSLIMAYIAEMGADPSLMQLAMGYDSSDMRYLSASEMAELRITTRPTGDATPPPPPTASLPRRDEGPELSVPIARTGRVRHPRGSVTMKANADAAAADVLAIRNGTPVRILEIAGRWYRASVSGTPGYLHDTWVLIDQFESGNFHDRHIQIKSFDNVADATAYAHNSPYRLSAYLATNGWFAVTLEDTFDAETGAKVLQALKSERKIPDDSYMSYGNTYARKVCCAR